MLRICLVVALTFLTLSCSKEKSTFDNNNPTSNPSPQAQQMQVKITATQVIAALKEAKLPVTNEVYFNEETDPNKLLGRPNQYIEKADFADTRLKQIDQSLMDKDQKDYPEGGTLEIFKNQEDLMNRKKWIETATKSVPMLTQYIFMHKNAMLRLDHALTPKQAEEYRVVLQKL